MKIVILGAGFGGLELATRLLELEPSLEVTLVDEREGFTVGFHKIDVLFGRKSVADVRHPYAQLAARATFRRERVQSIDPAVRRVVTSGGTLDADVLVVALGADVDASATPGLLAAGHDFYTLDGAARAAPAVAAFDSGRALIAILGVPYKCPPAPYEVALQLHDALVRRGVRDACTIDVVSPQPIQLPVTKEGSAKVAELMKERGIGFIPDTRVTHIEAGTREAVTKTGARLPFDLLLAVPVHRAPRVVFECGLADASGWVGVDARTLETKFPNVYALGDVTVIPVGQGAIPKAGAFADRAARAVADDIVARARGSAERGRFDGAGACYLEFGEGQVAEIKADFLGGPAPQVSFTGPTPDLLPQKTAFAAQRLARWFTTPK